MLKISFFWFPKVNWLQYKVRWANVQAIDVKFYQDLTHQKSLKSVNFWQSYWTNKGGTQSTSWSMAIRLMHCATMAFAVAVHAPWSATADVKSPIVAEMDDRDSVASTRKFYTKVEWKVGTHQCSDVGAVVNGVCRCSNACTRTSSSRRSQTTQIYQHMAWSAVVNVRRPYIDYIDFHDENTCLSCCVYNSTTPS